MPSGAARYAKWAGRFDPELTEMPQSLSVAMKRVMSNGVTPGIVESAFIALVSMEESVRGVLNGEGVSTIQYPFYLNFGRQMHKLTARIQGESAAVEAAILVAKWVARGLDETILEKIRTDVFSVPDPTP